MIHGESDSYISPEIAQGLFDRGKKFKELWLVSDAKHNRCRETDPEGYATRVVQLPRAVCASPSVAARAGGTRDRLCRPRYGRIVRFCRYIS